MLKFAAGFVTGFLVLFALIFVFGEREPEPASAVAQAQPAATVTATPTPAPTLTPPPSATPEPPTPLPTWTLEPSPTPAVYLGDTVAQNGYTLAALNLEIPASKPGILYEPQSGTKLIAVEIAVGNVAGDPFSSNVLNATLVDASGLLYRAETGAIDGQMQLHDVRPGETVRGWVGFAVPDSFHPVALKFDFDFLGSTIQTSLIPR